jgi:DNA-binding NarL/FixJ family response regulator
VQLSRVGDVIVVSDERPSLPGVLSESQRQVVYAVLEGFSNGEIASARGTSVKTVANQLYAIYRKLGLKSRQELVAMLVGAPVLELAGVSGDPPKPASEPVSEDDRPRS